MRAALLTPRRRYAIGGEGRRLLPALTGGAGSWWSAALLEATSWVPIGRMPPPPGGWDRVRDVVATHTGPVQSALLIHTAWYKESSYAGFMEGPNGRVFVKIHPDPASAEHEADGAAALQPLYGSSLAFPEILDRAEEIVITAAVTPAPGRAPSTSLAEVAVQAGRLSADEGQRSELAPLGDQETAALSDLVGPERAGVIGAAPTLLATVPMGTAHGDFVPWNVVVSEDRSYLIDLEQWGLLPAYFDLIHLTMQPRALDPQQAASIERALTDLRATLDPLVVDTSSDLLILAATYVELLRVLRSHISWPRNARMTSRSARFHASVIEGLLHR